MRKIIISLILVLGFIIFSVTVSAQSGAAGSGNTVSGSQGSGISLPDNLPQPDVLTTNFLGENHYYTVTFRGNGEAVVNLKVVLGNVQDQPLKTIDLRIPKVSPDDLIAYQIIREKSCLRYGGSGGPGIMMPDQSPSLGIRNQTCVQYQEPDYFQYWYGGSKYQKAGVELKGDIATVSLPNPIKANQSGSFVLYYRAFGYAKKDMFGQYNYSFETARVIDRIQTLQVGIETDSDLFLKGVKSNVNYRMTDNMTALKSVAGGMAAAVQSPLFDNYYQQIGQGTVVKNASNLQPLESLTVKGSYADSVLKLYAGTAVKSAIALLVVVGVLVLLTRWLLVKFKNRPSAAAQSRSLVFLESLGLSLGAAVLVVGYTFFIFVINRLLNNYYYYELNFIFLIFLTVISIGFYGLVILGPALLMGFKKSLLWGMATFALTVFWLGFFFIITVAVFFMINPRQDFPGPVPLMMNGSSGTKAQ